MLSDSELELLRRGETEPLKKIFESNYLTCISHVMRVCRCQNEDAKDLVMDAIIVLRDKILSNNYDNVNLQSFLISVAINKWKNRKSKYDRLVFYDPLDAERIQKNTHHDTYVSETDLRIRELNAIKHAIQNASDKCGDLLRRNLYDGVPLEILVDELGYKNYDVIKSMKSRCMKKVRLFISSNLRSK